MTDWSCTTLDHLYPSTVQGTPCFCGARTWAGAPRSKTLKIGAVVTVASDPDRAERIICEKLRGEDAYRIDASVHGRTLFDRDELIQTWKEKR